MSSSDRWADLGVRVLSGTLLAVLGLGAVWAGGYALQAFATLVAAGAMWEAARLAAPDRAAMARVAGAMGGLGIALNSVYHGPIWLAALGIAPLAILLGARRDRLIYLAYALAVMLAVYVFIALREGRGLAFVLWLVSVVILSDVLGYFGGRMMGGPKFWPRLSPKKTWSGTACGWLGAAIAGLGFALWGAESPLFLIALSVLTAFAAQMGDIAESAIKRRAGVKDASNLIPGHGGVLDRFDAMVGALAFLLVWALAGLPLPAFAG